MVNIVCSRWTDDFESDTSAEYTKNGSPTWDTTNAKVICNSDYEGFSPNIVFGEGTIDADIYLTNDNTRIGITFCSDRISSVGSSGNKYTIYGYDGAIRTTKVVNGVWTVISSTTVNQPAGHHKLHIERIGTLIYVKFDDIIVANLNDSTFSSGIVSLGRFAVTTGNVEYTNIAINYIDPNSPNGISYGIPSLSHGGRIGVQESITTSVDMTDIVSSDLKGYSMAKSISATESVALRITAKNNTDDTEIDASGSDKYWDVAMDGSTIYTRKSLETNFNDTDDSIIWQMSTDSGLPDSMICIGQANLKPLAITLEEDLI